MNSFLLSRPKAPLHRVLHFCQKCDRKFYVRFQERARFFQQAQCPFCNCLNPVQRPNKAQMQGRSSYSPFTSPYKQTFNADKQNPHYGHAKQASMKASLPKSPSENSLVENSLVKKKKFGDGRISLQKFWKELGPKKKLVLASLPILFPFSIALLFLSFYFLPELYLKQKPLEYIKRIQKNTPNQIVSSKGELVAELFSMKTGALKAADISQSMKDMIVFVEDQYFYEHGGIHWASILRAAFFNALSMAYRQGGSTITQQLARILLLEKDKTLLRKCREAALAFALERELSKEEILSAYLNFIYLGHGAYGIANASQFYFQKKLNELNFAQQLILVSLTSAPERYSPLRRPHLLKVKMGVIMERMREENFPVPYNYPEQYRTSFFDLNRSPSANVYHDRIDHAPYVTEYIRQKVGQILGKEYMYNAGLRIQTSLDLRLQQASVKESRNFIYEHASRFPPRRFREGAILKKSKSESLMSAFQDLSLGLIFTGCPSLKSKIPRLQTASIGIENKSGRILFLQGGTRFGVDNQLNRALHMYRQTGSAIKPIVYALAIESGVLHAASLLDDRPIFKAKSKANSKKETAATSKKQEKDYWTPANYGGVYEGPISVRRALSYSKNLPAIQVARLLGMRRLSEGFTSFFFPHNELMEKRFRRDESIALGSLEMSPMEMASAYSSLGNNGYIQRAKLLLAIYDASGQELYSAKNGDGSKWEFSGKLPERRQVLSGDSAEIILDLLSGASLRAGVKRGGYQRSSFVGKTGTSNQYRDAWFIGLTPEISAAVWLGFDDPSFSMHGGTGAKLAGPLWGRIMRHQKKSKEKFKFSPRAKEAKICPLTGRLYTASCLRKAQRELFRKRDNVKKLSSKITKMEKKEALLRKKKQRLLNVSEL